jgi:hypothetical protein
MDTAFLDDFRQTLDRAAQRLLMYSDADASHRPAPGKWSKKEIIGHLLDSASNNHGRFVRAQLQDDLVRAWHAYNLQIAHIMEAADTEALTRPRARHNLHELAWKEVPQSEPATLDYFMRDYVGHLKHHLGQALT